MLARLPKQLMGHAIRGIRTRLGMSQTAFAAALGMPGSHALVSSWERGKAQPDYGLLAKIATMGVVDVMASAEAQPAVVEGMTSREMIELQNLLRRMELLLGQARAIVDRAGERAIEEAEEAAEVTTVIEVHSEVSKSGAAAGAAAGGDAGRPRPRKAPKKRATAKSGAGESAGS